MELILNGEHVLQSNCRRKRMNKRILFSRFILVALIYSANTLPDQSNRYRPLAESMFDMMDAFSSTFQKRTKERDNDWIHREPNHSSWLAGTPSWGSGPPMNMNGVPLSPMLSPWGPGGMSFLPDFRNFSPPINTPYYNWRPDWSRATPLDGEWEDAVGNILSVVNNRFRISQSSDRYSEGYLLTESDNILSMQARESRYKRYYEFALHNDKLVLRDNSGNLLLFRRINR